MRATLDAPNSTELCVHSSALQPVTPHADCDRDRAGVLTLALLIVCPISQHATPSSTATASPAARSSDQPGSAMADKPNAAAVATMATATSIPPRPAALMCRITGGVSRMHCSHRTTRTDGALTGDVSH